MPVKEDRNKNDDFNMFSQILLGSGTPRMHEGDPRYASVG